MTLVNNLVADFEREKREQRAKGLHWYKKRCNECKEYFIPKYSLRIYCNSCRGKHDVRELETRI